MRWIVARSLRFRWLAVFGAAAVMVFGFIQAREAPLDVFPEFAPPIVEVQTIALGNTSKEVEEFVTIPIEDSLNGVEGLDKVRSYSVEQLSSIKLYFKRGSDLYRSRQLVQERLGGITAQLPAWASPPFMMPPLSSTARVLKIGVTSDELNMMELSAISYWKIKQRLLRVPGVANVLIYGERLQQRHIQLDPKKLAANGVSLVNVMETTANSLDAGVLQWAEAFTVGQGGFVEGNGQRINIRHVQPIETPQDLAKVPIEREDGKVIRLDDLGRVIEDYMPLWGDAAINQGPGIMLIVQKLPRANTLEVTKGVEKAIDEMKPGMPGVAFDTDLFRPATFVDMAIDNLMTALLLDVVAIVPVFFLSGLSGAFFQPLVLAYGLAVLVSMLVATTVTPALCFLLLSKGYREKESPLMRALKGGYGWLLARVMSRPGPAVVTAGLVMGAGLLIFPTLGQSLLPNFKENDLITYWATKPGTSLPETMRIANRGCRDYLKEVPAIDSCASHAGQALLGDEIHGVNFDEQWIHFKDGIDYDKSVAQIRGVIDSYPGLYRTVQTYLRERVKEVLSGANESIVVRTFGPDINVLEKKAEEIVARMSTVDGVIDAQVEQIEQIPQIQIQVKPEAARRHGITAGLVRRDSSALIASEEVGDLFYGGQAYDVHVWTIPSARDSVSDIENLPIDTPDGGTVPLKEVADIRIRPIANTIKREEQSRRLDATADVAGRDLASTVEDVKEHLAKVDFPPGYHAEVLGEAPELNAAQNDLALFGILAAIVIFLLLQAGLGSLRLAALVFLLLPMALAGALVAAKLSTGELALGSMVGLLTVLGIAGRNGILMIAHFRHLERVEGMPFGPALVLQGAKDRLAPILMTASATGLALVPLVLAGPVPGNEIEHPLAVTILGGLVTATLLNLFVLPSLYLAVAGWKRARVPTPAAESA